MSEGTNFYDDYERIKEGNPEYARLRWSKSATDRYKADDIENAFNDRRETIWFYKWLATAACAIGLFVGGIVLGPVAILLGRKIQRMGEDAGGRVAAGWVVTVIHFFITLAFIF